MSFLREYERWMKFADADTKRNLAVLTDEEKYDAFYRSLEFGTGGLRGVMGAGTNRINVYTVRRATQGVANELIESGEECSCTVKKQATENNR